jgi:hypothetical protein
MQMVSFGLILKSLGTLYDDGANIDEKNPVKKVIVNLLQTNPDLNIAIITAVFFLKDLNIP